MVETKRVTTPKYIVTCHHVHKHFPNQELVLGVFSTRDKAMEQIKKLVKDIKQDVGQHYQYTNEIEEEYTFRLEFARQGHFIEVTEWYRFEVIIFDEDYLYPCSLI